MDIEIIDEEDNPMLHRRDVTFEVVHEDATPSRLSVRDSLAAKLNKDADEVIVRELDTKFGMRRTIGSAKVYETPTFARDIEQEYMLQRNKVAPTDGAEADRSNEDEAQADEGDGEESAGNDDDAGDDEAEGAEADAPVEEA